MEQNATTNENPVAGVTKFYTKLKFIKSERNGALISFVSQNPINNIMCGVRQDSPYAKKIVIIDKNLASNILINVLYDCTLIPMNPTVNPNTGLEHIPGYIAIEAIPVQFHATITTKYIKGSQYQIEVSFGNKVIRFDPFKGKKESVKSFPACLALLEHRCDLQNIVDVAAHFTSAATELVAQMKQDMREIHNSKKQYDKTNRRDRH